MAKSVLDIAIRAYKTNDDGDKKMYRALTNMKVGITNAVAAFAAFAGVTYAVDKALDATVGKYVEYAQKVRETKLALGLSADETSRVIALTDDLGISYDDLSASIRKNADNTNYSIEGLAAASVQYLALGDAQERAAFAQKNYGKQWQEFSKLLEKGPDQIREMAAAVDAGHLFSDEDIQQAEEYRIQLDELSDSWEALSMSAGRSGLPLLNNALGEVTSNIEESGILVGILRFGFDDLFRIFTAGNETLDSATQSYIAQAQAMQTVSETSEILAVDYEKLLPAIQNMQNEMDRYNETQDEVNAANAQANADYAAGNISLEERNAILAENEAKLAENAAAHNEWAAQTVWSFAMARAAADGISEGEGEMLIGIGESLGLFDAKTAEAMQSVNSSFASLDTSDAQATIDAVKGSLEALTGREWEITITTNTSGVNIPSGGYGSHTGQGGYATGGAFDAGMPMQVHQDEILVPDYGGVVLTRTDAMRLLSGQGNTNNNKSVVINIGTIVAKGSILEVLEELT